MHGAQWALAATVVALALPARAVMAQACLGVPGITENTRVRFAFEQGTFEHGTERAMAVSFAGPGAGGVFGGATLATRYDPGLAASALLYGVAIGDRLAIRFVPGLSICPRLAARFIDGPDDLLFSGVDITERERELALAAGLDLAPAPRVRVALFASIAMLDLTHRERPPAGSAQSPSSSRTTLGEKQVGVGVLWDERIGVRISQSTLSRGDVVMSQPFASFARAPGERALRVEVSVRVR